MQWPFLNNTTAMQPFMSFKQHEERPRKIVFDQFSSGFQPISTVDAFEPSHKTSLALTPQVNNCLTHLGSHQTICPDQYIELKLLSFELAEIVQS